MLTRTSVNRTVIETHYAQRRRKKIILPSLEDIKKLHKYLKTIRQTTYLALKQSFSYNTWLSLAEVILTSIHTFNRRRAGEIKRILIEDFQNDEKLNRDTDMMLTDMYNSLSQKNKEVVEKYVRFCIRTKLGRTMLVLLSTDLFECINAILYFCRS